MQLQTYMLTDAKTKLDCEVLRKAKCVRGNRRGRL